MINKKELENLRINRAEHVANNLLSGMLLTLLVTVVPFVMRTLMMYILGDELLGLNSLFMSILGVLNISEMGIGSVMVFYLYAPVAKGDILKTNCFLNALRKMYRVIGTIIFIGGVLITPFIGFFIAGAEPNNAKIYSLFLVYLIATVIQYFLFPEEIILFDAFQRKDIDNTIVLLSNIILYILQIIALIAFKSYFLYLMALVVEVFIVGYLRKVYSVKYFPEYSPKGDITNEEKADVKKSIKAMIGHQIDIKLLNSIDNVFISSILGLSTLAIYGNYFFVITAVTMIIGVLYTSVSSSIGNAIIVETKESNYYRFKCFFLLNAIVAGWASICMLCLYQNFMMIWMGNKRLGMDMVILFCVYFYLSQIRMSVVTFKNAAGMWWCDRYKPYISMGVDLILDLILINIIGIRGAIISSIICVGIIEIPWETIVLFREYFNKPIKFYIKDSIKYGIVSVGIGGLAYSICEKCIPMTGVMTLIERALLCVSSIFIYLIIFCRTDEFRTWKQTFFEVIRKG